MQPHPAAGLPVDSNGDLDPSGGIASGKLPAGAQFQYGQRPFTDHRKTLNPLEGLPVRELYGQAKEKLNEYLRAHGQPIVPADQDVPPLLLLIELREYVPEPRKTDLYKALRNLTIPMCTSQEIVVKWARTPYKCVPYEVRAFPIHVADMILEQVSTFMYIPVFDEAKGFFVGRGVPAANAVQFSHKPFRKPKPHEIDGGFKLPAKGSRLVAQNPHSTSRALHLNLNPEDASEAVDVAGGKVEEVERDGKTRQQYVTGPRDSGPTLAAGLRNAGSTELPAGFEPAPEMAPESAVGVPAEATGAR